MKSKYTKQQICEALNFWSRKLTEATTGTGSYDQNEYLLELQSRYEELANQKNEYEEKIAEIEQKMKMASIEIQNIRKKMDHISYDVDDMNGNDTLNPEIDDTFDPEEYNPNPNDPTKISPRKARGFDLGDEYDLHKTADGLYGKGGSGKLGPGHDDLKRAREIQKQRRRDKEFRDSVMKA